MEARLNASRLTKEDTELYKGFGILLIVLHNYFHWVKPSPGENEFTFERSRTLALMQHLDSQPLEVINLFFSFFGHYGVQLFVFLSAYGLARSYEGRRPNWLSFMAKRAGKVYPALALAVVAHLLFVVTPWNEHLLWYLKAYALQLSLLTAFVPDMQFLLVGPWWFFSFVFQFYALFPLLNRVATRYGTTGLVVVGIAGIAVTALASPYLVPRGLNLYCTVVGHLPVLCLGIYAARTDRLPIDARVLLFALAVFALGKWFHWAWYLAPLCITVLLLAVAWPLVGARRTPGLLYRFMRYCGTVSLPLFAIHGMMRRPFTDAANAQDAWYFTLALAAVFLVASLAAAQVMQWIEDAGRSLLKTPAPMHDKGNDTWTRPNRTR